MENRSTSASVSTRAARRSRAMRISYLTAIGLALLVLIVNAVLPWPTGGGAYSGMGMMMMMPLLLMALFTAGMICMTIVAMVAHLNGLRGLQVLGVSLFSLALTLAAMLLGAN
ncbi:hypothetical protein [Stenotrophomonas indicatrix]|uniref:hypothetical protein n=1 Tax=Stenotrophomonas indicatrix TaxID=2045451 RepID=UPI0034341F75